MAQKKIETQIVISGKADGSLNSIVSELNGIADAVSGISGKAQQILQDSIDYYKSYEANMLDAKGALSAQYTNYSDLEHVMSELDEQAQQWAASSIFHTSDVSKAISEAAHAGWDYSQMISGIPAAMQLAQAGGYELSEALDQVIKVTNASGTEFEDVSGMIDMWAKAANLGATSVEAMGEAMTRMGSTVKFAGGMDEVMTMLTLLASMGTTGTEAGTLLRNTMLRLVAPTQKAASAMSELEVTDEESEELAADAETLAAANAELEKYGFSVYNEAGQLKSMTEIFTDLANVTDKMSDQERNTLLSAIFPTRTITGAMNLLDSIRNGDWTEILQQMSEAKGYAEEVADIQNEGLGRKLELFDSKIEAIETKIGSIATPNLKSILSFAGELLDGINNADGTTVSAITGLLEGIATVGPATAGLAAITAFLASMSSTTLGILGGAAAVTTLAGGLGMLYEVSKADWANQFGDVVVDLPTIEENLSKISAPFMAHAAEIKQAADDAKTAQNTFVENLTGLTSLFKTDEITGKTELSEEEAAKYTSYGEAMYDALIKGIDASKEKNVSLINSFWDQDDNESVDNPEEYELYNSIVDAELGFWSGLEGRVIEAIEQYRSAVATAASGVWTDAEKQAMQEAIDELQAAELQMAQYNADKAAFDAITKGSTVSWDSIQETMDAIEAARQEELSYQDEAYAANLAAGLEGYNQAHPGHEMTPEEYLNSVAGQEITSQYNANVTGTNERWGAQLNSAFATLLSGSGYEQAFALMQQVAADGGLKMYSAEELAQIRGTTVAEARDYIANGGDALNRAYYYDLGYDLYDTSKGSIIQQMAGLVQNADETATALNESGAIDLTDLNNLYTHAAGYNYMGKWMEPANDRYLTSDWSPVSSDYEINDPIAGFIESTVDPIMNSVVDGVTTWGANVADTFTNPSSPVVTWWNQLKTDFLAGDTVATATDLYNGAKQGIDYLNGEWTGIDVSPDAQTFIDSANGFGEDIDFNKVNEGLDTVSDYVYSSVPSQFFRTIADRVSESGVWDTYERFNAGPSASGAGEFPLPEGASEAVKSFFKGEYESDADAASALVNDFMTNFSPGIDTSETDAAKGLVSDLAANLNPDASVVSAVSSAGADIVSGATEAVPVSADTSVAQSDINALSGLSQEVSVSADTSSAESEIGALSRTVTVKVATIRSGGTNVYAEGGRATEASIFGEAGAEWAIPEEHSERTASLLDSARRASGFTWGELLERTGGLNASTSGGSSTLVYSPTINATDTSGVADVLARDKDALRKWWQSMQRKDSMEVYA